MGIASVQDQASKHVTLQNNINDTAMKLIQDKLSGSPSSYTADFADGFQDYQSKGGTDTQGQYAYELSGAAENVGPALSASSADLDAVQDFLFNEGAGFGLGTPSSPAYHNGFGSVNWGDAGSIIAWAQSDNSKGGFTNDLNNLNTAYQSFQADPGVSTASGYATALFQLAKDEGATTVSQTNLKIAAQAVLKNPNLTEQQVDQVVDDAFARIPGGLAGVGYADDSGGDANDSGGDGNDGVNNENKGV